MSPTMPRESTFAPENGSRLPMAKRRPSSRRKTATCSPFTKAQTPQFGTISSTRQTFTCLLPKETHDSFATAMPCACGRFGGVFGRVAHSSSAPPAFMHLIDPRLGVRARALHGRGEQVVHRLPGALHLRRERVA